ncbi:methyltransferase-like protein isoform X2 [Diaphorina citri]|uniref:tRNA N(3)-methylcytidine methyltransferase n=1 Tax=Diaphorina citri TaxID=121845 RepID=A0A1S3CY88_DIACI|nr:methyltransferase-like protein isoform X1 [Diaphorina citri]XP_008469472.1 methyltransferase-like protein isoform X1 [Diaphorina citri]XP_026677743.1 methyltransferase-like protein isoform X2 [Diaphorina citri]
MLIQFYVKRPVFRQVVFTVSYQILTSNYCNGSKFDYESTRYRKKPPSDKSDRILRSNSQVFDFNSWDHVQWDEEQEQQARKLVENNSVLQIDKNLIQTLNEDVAKNWDAFYNVHQNRFFKDRHWLFTEFTEIIEPLSSTKTDTCSTKNILEIGCGVGNSVFPIVEHCKNDNVFVYGCDFSENAVNILKEHEEYKPDRCHAFVCDVTSEDWNPPFAPESLDIVLLIFVLDAINPNKMQHVINQVYKYLKPGGMVLFRDYGRYDLVQLRFKKGRCLQDNFYARGDGTLVYFFTREEVKTMFESAGFVEKQNLIDRRLQVNRGKQIKMYRVWIQAKYMKPLS